MSDLKQVKVDNWGIFFLQKLKNFFNRTDYCDLTLQFQDNTQLKVHRLVLNACTEYFEILERTCEMYEDCLIMPDDLQTDVMVPIINFMYTGHLEYKNEMLDKLYQTSQIMNMTVLTKLLDAQRNQIKESQGTQKYQHKIPKRSYNKAFGTVEIHKNKMYNTHCVAPKHTSAKQIKLDKSLIKKSISCIPVSHVRKKMDNFGKKPIRYDIPDELDTDNLIDDSFTNISYDSKPLMVHPDAKRYAAKKPTYGIFSEANARDDIVEFKRISSRTRDSIFDELASETYNAGSSLCESTNTVINRNSEQLFDQMLNDGSKLTIGTKHGNSGNLDHVKIISDVLKKYPHIININKNYRLKLLNPDAQSKSVKKTTRSDRNVPLKDVKQEPSNTYESEILDSQEAARLISLGPHNVKGPWICLICGTPGKALNFTSYYKFRRHLVEIHNEKPISNCCEHCGLKSSKRNYLIHHMYTKHGVEPPAACNFPKCNKCDYIGLNEGFLTRHKMQHDMEPKSYRCNSCSKTFRTLQLLLTHIQMTGRKCGKAIKCVYCQKYFLKEVSLYAHFKMCHKNEAKNDGILDNSDEDEKSSKLPHKTGSDDCEAEDSNDVQYQIEQQYDGNIQLLTKKVNKVVPTPKILNKNFNTGNTSKVLVRNINNTIVQNELNEAELDEIEVEQPENGTKKTIEIIHNSEFIQKQPFKNEGKLVSEEYVFEETLPSTSIQVPQDSNNEYVDTTNFDQTKMLMKKPQNINQSIQIVVSSEEEYKALMASNPSIIFDEGNPNKTLTVLTAPHASTLNATTIDLNNPQDGMMILPENFSLNVSEAIPTENSNIVVVYSHPVDGENKQYLVNSVNYAQPQLISSQEIDAQFVSTSAVITQNFETITTSTSMDPGQIIVQQPVETWQTNVQQNIENQLNNGQQFEMTVNQSDQIMQDVPELSNGQTTAEDELAELPDITNHESQSNVLPNTQNDEVTNVGIIMSTSNEAATYIQGDEEDNVSTGKILSNSAINVTNENCHVETDNIVLEHSHIMEVVQETKINSLKSILPHETKTFIVDDKIKNLTSEWSDDEENSNSNNLLEQTSNVIGEENESTDIVNEIKPVEVEECIENIKQEVARQEVLVSGLNTSVVNEENHDHANETDVSDVNKEHISTLINDWDENDSQKADSTENEIVNTSIERDFVEQPQDETDGKAPIEVVLDKADDKIKKLVSDWDEEDDDDK